MATTAAAVLARQIVVKSPSAVQPVPAKKQLSENTMIAMTRANWQKVNAIAEAIAQNDVEFALDIAPVVVEWNNAFDNFGAKAALTNLCSLVINHEIAIVAKRGIPDGFQQAVLIAQDTRVKPWERAEMAHKVTQAIRKAQEVAVFTRIFDNITRDVLRLPTQFGTEARQLLKSLDGIWAVAHFCHVLEQEFLGTDPQLQKLDSLRVKAEALASITPKNCLRPIYKDNLHRAGRLGMIAREMDEAQATADTAARNTTQPAIASRTSQRANGPRAKARRGRSLDRKVADTVVFLALLEQEEAQHADLMEEPEEPRDYEPEEN